AQMAVGQQTGHGVEQLRWRKALFALLAADVDLEEHGQYLAGGLGLPVEAVGDLHPIDGVDQGKGADTLRRLAALDGADEVPADLRRQPTRLGHGYLVPEFLQPVLAEIELAGRQRFFDARKGLRLADGDQGHAGRVAAGAPGG